MIITNLIFSIIFLIISILFCKKFSFLEDKKKDNHKKFLNTQKNHILGGLTLILFFSTYILSNGEYLFFLFLFCIFLLGLFSDIRLLDDPKKRFFMQFVFIYLFTYLLEINILTTRINLIDAVLENSFINYFFVTFCLMVLINGGNFIDGLNTLLSSYILIILLVLALKSPERITDYNFFISLITLLVTIILFNSFGLIILGDSGAYLLSIFLGVYLIEYSNFNLGISPYLIILLLWYPCFELLFSMTRRYLKKKNSYLPDTEHLHQLIYLAIKSKYNFKEKINHIIVSSLIILFNLIIFTVAMNYIFSTKALSLLILFNLFCYISIYFYLKKTYIK